MAGRRHHYLPRFIQRQFAHRQKGKQFYVFAHHRAHGAYQTNVMELGQETDFYGDGSALDDAITAGERQLAITLHRIGSGVPVSQYDLAALVSALSIRTKAMREALVSIFPVALAAGRERMLDERVIRQRLMESLSDPAKQRELIEEQIQKSYPDLDREGRAKFRALASLRWSSFVASREEEFLREARRLTEFLLDTILAKADSLADQAYLDALGRDPITPKRVEKLVQSMIFEVWTIDGDSEEFFVLGDCGPIGLYSDGIPRLALGSFSSEVELDFVFLPVAPTRCIVGSRSGGRVCSVDDVNKMSASLSYDFLVSHVEEGAGLDGLRAVIGTRAPLETEERVFESLSS